MLGAIEGLSGTRAADHLAGDDGPNQLDASAHHDLDTGGDVLIGRGGDDDLRGGDAADRLAGGDGDDRLAGGPGVDELDGGAGDDAITTGALFVSPARRTERVACGAGEDTVGAAPPRDQRLAPDCEWVRAGDVRFRLRGNRVLADPRNELGCGARFALLTAGRRPRLLAEGRTRLRPTALGRRRLPDLDRVRLRYRHRSCLGGSQVHTAAVVVVDR